MKNPLPIVLISDANATCFRLIVSTWHAIRAGKRIAFRV